MKNNFWREEKYTFLETIYRFLEVTSYYYSSNSNSSQRLNLDSTVYIRRGGLLGIRLAREGSPSNRVDQSRSSSRDDSWNRGENNEGSYPQAWFRLPLRWKHDFLRKVLLVLSINTFPIPIFINIYHINLYD